jgi:serine/threonine protein kinase
MTAKISDLGVARILNLTPLQVSRMTQTPGTPAYMPPEVMVANPKYDTSVDEFSYGILMIHMFSGQWPEPQVGPNRTGPNSRLIPVTEAERREVFLRAIGNDHPLINLILKCVNNHPKSRAHTNEIVERLAEMVLQLPAPLASRLDILRRINALEAEKQALAENGKRKDLMIQEKEDDVSICRQELRAQEEQKAAEINQLKLFHSSEVGHLHLQLQDLNTENQLTKDETEAEITELKSKVTTLETDVENKINSLSKREKEFEMQLVREREENRKLITEKNDLQSKLYALEAAVSKLETNIAEYESTIQAKDTSAKRMGTEIDAKSKALAEKDATISAMSEQLSKSREYLTLNKQVRAIK